NGFTPEFTKLERTCADDYEYYAKTLLTTVLPNIKPHSTGMVALTPVEKHDIKIWEVQQQYCEFSLSDASAFTYARNPRFIRSNYDELSIIAKRKINKGDTITELVGATYRIEKRFLYEGQNDYSVIYSDRAKSDMLFLGPAAFCNHACLPNATLKCINKKVTGVVAIQNIHPGEEICIFYGKNYFENNNEECNCVTCFEIRQKNSTYTSDSQITDATPESEIDCTFLGNPVIYMSPESATIVGEVYEKK
ncbi:histone-lysine N-methyltransferase KMT5B-like, partial [Aphis craccivora]